MAKNVTYTGVNQYVDNDNKCACGSSFKTRTGECATCSSRENANARADQATRNRHSDLNLEREIRAINREFDCLEYADGL